MNEEIKKLEEDKLYGEPKWLLYDYDVDKSYKFISKNTGYLDNITRDEIKDIAYSYYNEIIILLKDGTLFINGKNKYI